MKIAILGSRGYPYVYSGYETFIKELVERLNHKHEFHVYCHSNLFDEQPAEVNRVKLHYLPAIELKSFSQLSHSLLSTIHAIFCNYDIVYYVNTANGPFGYFFKLTKIPSAINTDGLEWLRPKWQGLGSKYFYWASKTATKAFDILVADSDEMARIYKDKFNRDSEIIAYGANIKDHIPEIKISKTGIEPGNYYLIVGRLIPDNNADIIIEGFLKSSTDKKLVIVGDVPYKKDAFAQKIKQFQSEKIIFTGYITDQEELYALYYYSYCYLHGHEYGGTNPTLLKALAYGCAIIALNTPFSREVLSGDKYGLYFQKTPAAVAGQINYTDNNPDKIQQLKKIGRNRIAENYTWEKIAQQYDNLFKKMISKK